VETAAESRLTDHQANGATDLVTEHFQQCAEFLPLGNRGLSPLAVAVLTIAVARRATATACAAV
jgi:hypothetical protein